MNNQPVRVSIVDDSAVIRGLLTRALSQDSEIEVVGTAMHGESALSWLRNNSADVVVLDVEMPVMDGLETMRQIQQHHPRIRVIMASSLTVAGAKTTMLALSLGAAACIAKPNTSSTAAAMEVLSRELIPLVKGLVRRPTLAAPRGEGKPAAPQPGTNPLSKRVYMLQPPSLLVIGASTGGPNALSRVLCDLGPEFDIPTLVVQHMPPMFTAIMANHLQNDTGRTVKEAQHGERLQPGVTYVAPGDFHLEIKALLQDRILELHQGPVEHYCRPSVNPLFRSAARVAGSRLLAVMLTGMGSDGLEGTQEIVQAGGYVLAQDEASSVVWGMPGAIVNGGLANEVLPLQEIGSRILRLCHRVTTSAKANRQ